jgi:hypothetical protein
MNLLTAFVFLLDLWRPAFCKKQAFIRAKEHAFASLCAFGRKTITSFAIFLRRDQTSIVADYKLYSEYKWNPRDLFNPLLEKGLKYVSGNYITIAADDTRLPKSGKKIPHASWGRDPMSPHFHINLMWGLRFLQMSLIFPLYKTDDQIPPRAIPVRFIDAPSIKKPGKKASQEEIKIYKEKIKIHNLSTIFVQHAKELRQALDQMKYQDKTLLYSVDGSLCNKIVLRITDEDPRIQVVGRCRKNIKLCFKNEGGGRRFYDQKKFTPEDIRRDETIPWQEKQIFYGGEFRTIRCKEVNHVLWQGGTRRKNLRLIVIAPIPYIRAGKRNYRYPAYLLCTDINGDLEEIIQAYFDRFSIEYNHREEKSVIGVGQAQVRNENSVSKQPALHVAAYSALLLASVMAYQDKYHADFGEIPYWRPYPKRNTCRSLVGNLRKSLLEQPEKIVELELTTSIIMAILSKSA